MRKILNYNLTVKEVENKLDTPQMREKLGQAQKDVTTAIEKIVKYAFLLSKDLKNKKAKNGLLKGSKKLLKNMVNCLQLADIHECNYLIKLSNQITHQIQSLNNISTNTRSVSEFRNLIPILLENLILLRKASHQRSQVISQIKFKTLVFLSFHLLFFAFFFPSFPLSRLAISSSLYPRLLCHSCPFSSVLRSISIFLLFCFVL